jgi:hypothetical protein
MKTLKDIFIVAASLAVLPIQAMAIDTTSTVIKDNCAFAELTVSPGVDTTAVALMHCLNIKDMVTAFGTGVVVYFPNTGIEAATAAYNGNRTVQIEMIANGPQLDHGLNAITLDGKTLGPMFPHGERVVSGGLLARENTTDWSFYTHLLDTLSVAKVPFKSSPKDGSLPTVDSFERKLFFEGADNEFKLFISERGPYYFRNQLISGFSGINAEGLLPDGKVAKKDDFVLSKRDSNALYLMLKVGSSERLVLRLNGAGNQLKCENSNSCVLITRFPTK